MEFNHFSSRTLVYQRPKQEIFRVLSDMIALCGNKDRIVEFGALPLLLQMTLRGGKTLLQNGEEGLTLKKKKPWKQICACIMLCVHVQRDQDNKDIVKMNDNEHINLEHRLHLHREWGAYVCNMMRWGVFNILLSIKY